MWNKLQTKMASARLWANRLLHEEQGDFGVGQIALMVASVVVIGVIVMVITGLMPEWIESVWGRIEGWFDQIGSV